jgi:hypothetical protein
MMTFAALIDAECIELILVWSAEHASGSVGIEDRKIRCVIANAASDA